ncbi:MAG TPA: GNAT family N-acetyltransferase [Chthonomonadales bacterium]|nr:GNAT family N-acetyltransferase [Chthonomonadales bacterium]
MEIRQVHETEMDHVLRLLSQAFMQGSRDDAFLREPSPPIVAQGAWENGTLHAQVAVLAWKVRLGPEVVLPMGGVAGVACLPASRGKGYAGALLRRALERMREDGQPVSALFPFSWDYYRRFGWEWAGVGRTYAAETCSLRPSPETGRVRPATAEDRDAIASVYGRVARRYRGMVERHPVHWGQILNDTEKEFTYTYVHEGDSGIDGYLTYRGGSREETMLREFLALTPQALAGLLGLLRRHDMQTDKVEWRAPADDLLWMQGYHSDLHTDIAPVAQARVVDVEAAIRAWKPLPDREGRVTMAVTDDSAPWNEGAWSVEYGGGEASIARCEGEPQVSLGIGPLSQAYWGGAELDDLRRAGAVDVRDEAGFAALRDLLAGPTMWMNDSF